MYLLKKYWLLFLLFFIFFFCMSMVNYGILQSFCVAIAIPTLAITSIELKIRGISKNRKVFISKYFDANPIHLYIGSPCAIYDTSEPVSAFIEGYDSCQDKIISERVNYDPKIIKPILRDISNITNSEALEVANLVWFALGNKKINKVEIKSTPLFPYAAIYFDWSPDSDSYEKAEDKEEWLRNNGEVKTDKFILSLDNAHHTIKLFRIEQVETDSSKNYEKLIPMPVYQSHKVTAYLLSKGFNLGILEEGTYIIRNYGF